MILRDKSWGRVAVKIMTFNIFFSRVILAANMKRYLLKHHKLLFLDFIRMNIYASYVTLGTSLKFVYHERMMKENSYIYDRKTTN